MASLRSNFFFWSAGSLVVGAAVSAAMAACSTSPSSGGDGGTATCSAPGSATPGPADTHCQGQPPQPVDTASCHPDAGATVGNGGDGGAGEGGGGASCPYGSTTFGQSAVDDDCKYKVTWTSSPICEGSGGVQFTATVKSNVDGTPVTGVPGGVIVEAFIPTSLDASCDNASTHPAPGAPALAETAPGSGVYVGNVVFDAPGEWTVRFHIHEECADLLPTSPHGHVAFHLTVP